MHRIGRTGRAGREGFAATLVTPKEIKAIRAIERLLRQDIPWIDGQPSAEEVARASEDRGDSNGRHRRGSRSNRHKGSGAHGASHTGPSLSARNRSDMKGRRLPSRPSPIRSKISRGGTIISSLRPFRGNQRTAPRSGRPTPIQIKIKRRQQSSTPIRVTGRLPKAPQPSRGGERGMGEHVPAFMMRSVRPLD